MARLDRVNTSFLVAAHLTAVAAVIYMVKVQFSWPTVILAVVWLMLCGLAVTGGYHRLFAHRTYKANTFLRAMYLGFGAAAVQNSALKWSADHRIHHANTDRDGDPYNIRRGFWWAHVGWVLHKAPPRQLSGVTDLSADPLVMFQHKHYVLVAGVFAAVLPFCLGLLWGDPWGALLVAGFLRLVVQWHSTFAINSFAHYLGNQPYCTDTSARDSLWTALISFGEGYHNFHHRFQSDFRNGIKWFHYDPTKWFIWGMSKCGVTWDLKRTPDAAILRARDAVAAGRAEASER